MAYPAIWTKYLGPTDRRGARVKATTIDNRSVTLHWNDALNSADNHEAAAVALAKRLGLFGTMIAADGGSTGYIFAWTRRTFESGGFADAQQVKVSR